MSVPGGNGGVGTTGFFLYANTVVPLVRPAHANMCLENYFLQDTVRPHLTAGD